VDSRRPTWLTTYNQSLNFRADNAYVHRRPRHWLYHRPVSESLAIELSPSQRQKRGTVCRRKWRHHHNLHHYQPLNLNWKLIYFHSPTQICKVTEVLCTIHLKFNVCMYYRRMGIIEGLFCFCYICCCHWPQSRSASQFTYDQKIILHQFAIWMNLTNFLWIWAADLFLGWPVDTGQISTSVISDNLFNVLIKWRNVPFAWELEQL